MLIVNHLSVRFAEKQVLSDVSLHVAAGQLLCVGGESGSGKSTLMKAVLGFVESEGEVLIGGERLTAESVGRLRKQTAYVPQELALPSETVEQMVMMPFTLKANKKYAPARETLLAEWERLGLDETLLEKRPTEVSGGQRQRMMLATAGLLHKPLLLADEPTSALDADTALRVRSYFQFLATDRGTAILLVSHAPQLLSLPGTLLLPSRK